MTFFAALLCTSLIFAEREFTGPLFDAAPVHALDEPSAGEHDDPLRRWVLVPLSHPTDRLDGEDNGRGMGTLLVIPLRICGTDLFQVIVREPELRLVTDTIRV